MGAISGSGTITIVLATPENPYFDLLVAQAEIPAAQSVKIINTCRPLCDDIVDLGVPPRPCATHPQPIPCVSELP